MCCSKIQMLSTKLNTVYYAQTCEGITEDEINPKSHRNTKVLR